MLENSNTNLYFSLYDAVNNFSWNNSSVNIKNIIGYKMFCFGCFFLPSLSKMLL